MTEQTWLDLAKIFGIPVTMLMFSLWSGYYQVWHWHRELVDLATRLTEMREDRDYWRDQRMSQLTELEKKAQERIYLDRVRDRERDYKERG